MSSGHTRKMVTVLVPNSPTLVLLDNDKRDHFYVELLSGSGVSLGPDISSMLKPLALVGDYYTNKGDLGAWYMSTATGTATVLVYECEQSR